MPDPLVPGYTSVANPSGAFGETAQIPGYQDQFTLAPAGGVGGLTPVTVTSGVSHTQGINELTIVATPSLQLGINLPPITEIGQMAAAWWPPSVPSGPTASGGSVSPGAGANIGGQSLVVVASYLPYYGSGYYIELLAVSATRWIVTQAVGTDTASTVNGDPRYGGMSIGGPFVSNAGFIRTATVLTTGNFPYTTTTAESIILAGGVGNRTLTLTPPDIAAEYIVLNTSPAGYLSIVGGTGPAGQTISTIGGLATFNLGPGEGLHIAGTVGNLAIIGSIGRGYGNVNGATSALVKVTTARTALPNENTLVTGASTITVTLPATLTPNARNRVSNGGSGTVTVAPGTGTLTSLAAVVGNMTLAAGATAEYMNDGTNYFQVA